MFPQRPAYCCLPVLIVLLTFSTVYAEPVDYIKQIKPLLKTKCLSCHGPVKQESGFRVDSAKFLQQGGENEIGFEPGKAEESFLLGVLTGDAGFNMPPEDSGKPLSAEELKLIRDWINAGAIAPADEKAEEDPRQYWSYQLPKKPAVPVVKNKKWIRNEIDAFLSAEHERQGLVPRPEAAPAVLLRRLYLDLIGLPPTRKELAAYLENPSDEAYARAVEKLLASKQYGERWGRHWMDVWRYSDWYGSRGGNEIRYSQRHIWRWRDWIVESVNADKPYDRMIIEMLAGDELEPGNPDVVRATGFLGRNWYKFDRNVWMYETVEQTSVAFLGLTMKCCRCHEHKYDPLEQTDYYQFRAFFEPHHVRVDAVSANTKTVKDSDVGQVLTNGLSRVFDKELEAPTFRFIRGDDRNPDKEHPIQPGVPAVLGNNKIEIKPVSLPVESYYPALQPKLLEELVQSSTEKIQTAQNELKDAQVAVEIIKDKISNSIPPKPEQIADNEKSNSENTILVDDFSEANPALWNPVSGKWKYKDGHLKQLQVGRFVTMVSKIDVPLNFQGRLLYKTLQAGGVHSVGLFFDAINLTNTQAIYTATNNKKASVQAFHRVAGRESYPRKGIFPCDIKLDEDVTLDFVVQGQQLNVWLNGELKIVYTMPIARKVGKFALWNHSANAEFYELRLEKIDPGFQLAKSLDEKKRSPFVKPSKELLQRELNDAQFSVKQAQLSIQIRKAELTALHARIAADRAKIAENKSFEQLATKASHLERELAVLNATQKVNHAEHLVESAKASSDQDKKTDEKNKAKIAKDKKALIAARKNLETAIANAKKEDSMYTPLGKVYPKTSTGRRLALARWIANKKNPRTARVAVNHIWRRHFNQAIVPTVANFGLNGQSPTHPELLDWLAVTFVEQGWQMKPMHRLMVLSSAYRMSSAAGSSKSNQSIDPDNKYYWRMNSRRMEAEVVRDTLLATAGKLDLTMSGPELEEKQGETIFRRSMYFRITPNEKMEFLELFDLANPNACYERSVSVVPQQALAITNSSLALDQARSLAEQLSKEVGTGSDEKTERNFVQAAFQQILSRPATTKEITTCLKFLKQHPELLKQKENDTFPGGGTSKRRPSPDLHQRARENLVHVLYSHNDFVTVR